VRSQVAHAASGEGVEARRTRDSASIAAERVPALLVYRDEEYVAGSRSALAAARAPFGVVHRHEFRMRGLDRTSPDARFGTACHEGSAQDVQERAGV